MARIMDTLAMSLNDRADACSDGTKLAERAEAERLFMRACILRDLAAAVHRTSCQLWPDTKP